MADVERVVVADDGVRLWTCSSGRGVPLILYHGGPGLWDQGTPVARMIDDLTTVVRWDQRGGGRSEVVGPYTVLRFLADLDAVRVAYGFERCVVAGHSWGAGLALRYCLARPAHALGLVAVSGTDLGWNQRQAVYTQARRERLGRQLARWTELRAQAHRSAAERRELVLLTWSTDFANRRDALALAERWGWLDHPINHEANVALGGELGAEDTAALVAACRGLHVPAVVIHGSDDPRPIDGPAELAHTLPQGRLVELPGVGHVPWAEKPELLRAAFRAFLGGLAVP